MRREILSGSQACINLGAQASSLLLALLLSISPAMSAEDSCPADEAVSKEATTGANIFSSPQDRATPSFTAARGGEGKLRRALLGNTKDDIPDFRQIKMIPSLTAAQRKEFKEIYTANKDKFGDVMAEGKKLREKFGPGEEGKKSLAMADPQTKARLQQIRTQVREIRTRTWEQVKAKLTQQQLSELDQMRKGTLQPATFKEPMSEDSSRVMK